MTLQGFLILVILFVALGVGVAVISQNGGWQGGCGGNCAHCHQRCADPEQTLAEKAKKDDPA